MGSLWFQSYKLMESQRFECILHWENAGGDLRLDVSASVTDGLATCSGTTQGQTKN